MQPNVLYDLLSNGEKSVSEINPQAEKDSPKESLPSQERLRSNTETLSNTSHN